MVLHPQPDRVHLDLGVVTRPLGGVIDSELGVLQCAPVYLD